MLNLPSLLRTAAHCTAPHRPSAHRLVALLLPLSICCCGLSPTEPQSGEFSTLVYNVAALPQGLSSSDPERTIPLISPELNAWDLVLVQEDFAFQRELRADVELPYQSYPKETNGLLGDGLNRFSNLEFDPDVERVRWEECSGITGGSNDCLAEKGFSVATHTLAEGIELVIVNLHMDAGGGEENGAARAAQAEQLIAHLGGVSPAAALIVAGDTNLRPSDVEDNDAEVLDRIKAGLNIEDVCVPLDCGEEDRIDRALLRSGAALEITGTAYRLAEELVDDEGEMLSDHLAVEIIMTWTEIDLE